MIKSIGKHRLSAKTYVGNQKGCDHTSEDARCATAQRHASCWDTDTQGTCKGAFGINRTGKYYAEPPLRDLCTKYRSS